MGFQSFAKGQADANTDIASMRRERQQRLANYVNGFELNKQTGEYEANQRGQLAMQEQQQKLAQNVAYTAMQNKMIADQMSTVGMTQFTQMLLTGNPNNAQKVVENNPILKDRLRQSFGFSRVTTLDPKNDANILAKYGIYVDADKIASDPKARQAFNAMFQKGIKADGSVDLINTPSLIKQTNYKQYVSDEDYAKTADVFNKLGEILQGKVKTKAEIEAEQARLNAQTATNNAVATNATYAGGVSELKLKDLEEFKAQNPNATIDDFLKYRAEKQPNQGIDPKTQADIQLTQAKIDTEKSKQDKMKADIEHLSFSDKLNAEKIKQQALKDMPENEVAKYKENVNKIDDIYSKVANGKDISKDDVANILAMKATTPKNLSLPTKTKTDIDTAIPMIDAVADATDALNKAKDVDVNAVSNIVSDIKKHISWTTDDKGHKVLVTKGLNKLVTKYVDSNSSDANTLIRSKIGRALVLYVKNISGAAVTNEEFDRLTSLMTGGKYADIHAVRMLFNDFYKANRDRVLTTVKNGAYIDPTIMLQIKGRKFLKVKPVNYQITNDTNNKQQATPKAQPQPTGKPADINNFM